MNERRPLALVIYCALLGAFVLFGVLYGAYTLFSGPRQSTIVDAALAFVPIAILTTGLAGMWFMRWWAVALFWVCVLLMTLIMLLVPFPVQTDVSVLAVNVAIWVGALAAPPTLIGLTYRSRFR